MELHATGFNAWNQLCFDNDAQAVDEPEDVDSFTCILKDEWISSPQCFLSYTRVNTASGWKIAGVAPSGHDTLIEDAGHYAEASNGRVVVCHDGTVTEYRDATSLVTSSGGLSRPQLVNTVRVVAYAAGFAALNTSGHVWTWGDERYPACLGRVLVDGRYVSSPEKEDAAEVDTRIAGRPTHDPALVDDLSDLPTGPIVRIAAGGYLLAALTEGRDLYCWGGHPGKSPFIHIDPAGPIPVSIDGKDILDVAIGDAHMLVLTAEHEVYVTGGNSSGQLGLGPSSAEQVEGWTKVEIGQAGRSKVVGVAAGPRTSFALLQHQTQSHPA